MNDQGPSTGKYSGERLEQYLEQLSVEERDGLREALAHEGLPSRNQSILEILKSIDRPELQRAIADTLGIPPQHIGKADLHVYDGNIRALYRSALRSQGYTLAQYLALPKEDRQQLREYIQSALREPSKAADAGYLRLDEVVSLVRLQLEQKGERASYYQDLVSNGLSHDQLKQVLGVDHSVQPATIGHDIQSQSRNQWRAFVELVSNAVDASTGSHASIGRFGVGFYQVLSHLRTKDDEVKVVTSTEQGAVGTEISFRLIDDAVHVSVQPTEEPVDIGTLVEVKAEHLSQHSINHAIGRTFAYSEGITLNLNGNPWKPGGTAKEMSAALRSKVKQEDFQFEIMEVACRPSRYLSVCSYQN